MSFDFKSKLNFKTFKFIEKSICPKKISFKMGDLKFPCRGTIKDVKELFIINDLNRKGSCKYCFRQNLSTKSTRLKQHVVTCQSISQDIKKEFIFERDLESYNLATERSINNCNQDFSLNNFFLPTCFKSNLSESSFNSTSDSSLNSPEDSKLNVPKKRDIAKSMLADSTKSSTTLEKKQKVFTEAIFSTQQSFNSFRHHKWKKALNLIAPGFIIPTKKDMLEKYLPQISKNVSNSIDRLIAESLATNLIIDKWSNVMNESIIEISVTTTSSTRAHFLKSICTSQEDINANYLFDLIKPIIQNYPTISSIANDNTSEMIAMNRLVNQQYPNKITYSCGAHQLTLLLDLVRNSLIESINLMENLISQVQTPPEMCAKFQDFWQNFKFKNEISNYRRFKQFTETNFFSLMNEYSSILNAEEVLKAFALRPQNNFSLEFVNLWSNDAIYERFKNEYKLVRFVGKCIALIESDDSSISVIPFVMNKLKENIGDFLEKINLDQIQASEIIYEVDNRFTKMINKQNLLANLLDPEFKGSLLSPEQLETAHQYSNEYLTENNGYTSEQLKSIKKIFQIYLTGTGLFNSILHGKTRNISSVQWWSAFMSYKDYKEMAKFAIKFVSLKPLSTKIEHNMRKKNLVQFELRTVLENEKFDKILQIELFNKDSNCSSNKILLEELCEEITDDGDDLNSLDFSEFF